MIHDDDFEIENAGLNVVNPPEIDASGVQVTLPPNVLDRIVDWAAVRVEEHMRMRADKLVRERIDGIIQEAFDEAVGDVAEPAAGGGREKLQALVQEVDELPNPERSLLSHNERVLIEFCQRLAEPLRSILSAPAGAQTAGREGWRTKAADEIDAIADLWSGDGRAYAKTIAAILRTEEPGELPPADAKTIETVRRAWDRFQAGTAPPSSTATAPDAPEGGQ